MISGDSLGSRRRRHILLLSGFIDWNGSIRSLLLDYHDHCSGCGEFDILLDPYSWRSTVRDISIWIRLSQHSLKQSWFNHAHRDSRRHPHISPIHAIHPHHGNHPVCNNGIWPSYCLCCIQLARRIAKRSNHSQHRLLFQSLFQLVQLRHQKLEFQAQETQFQIHLPLVQVLVLVHSEVCLCP